MRKIDDYIYYGKTKGSRTDGVFEAENTFDNREKLIRGEVRKIPLVQKKFQLTGPRAADPF